MRIYRRPGVLAAALAVAVAVSAIAASSASAVLTTLPNGQTLSYQPLRNAAPQPIPFDNAFGNLDYNGGPVMPSNTDYIIFWSPKGLGAYGPGTVPQYVSGLEQFFKDLSHDNGGHQNVDSVSTQYNDLTGARANYAVTFGGGLLDTHKFPTSQCPVNAPVIECMSDAQLQHEITRFVTEHHLPTDLNHEYFLMTPPHVEGCFTNIAPTYGGCSAGFVPQTLAVYCAYHQNTMTSPMLFYSIDMYVTGNPGCDDGNHPNGPSDGAIQGGLSHEHNESITDPIPNDAWTNGSGANHGLENGDQCNGVMGPPLGTHNGALYNQVIHGHYYWYQEEWSNQGHTCLQRWTLKGSEPTATYTATAGDGLNMVFNATGSTAPGGVADFSWQFNDLFGASTVEKTVPTITHKFPATGAYSTGLAVFASDGLSTGTGGIITTGHTGFTPGFTFEPGNPVAGQSVTFKGLTTVSGLPVSDYLWEFGDGTTGSGAAPTHTYAAAGTYTIKAVLFSGVGSAFPGAGAAPVVAQTITVR